MSAEVLEQSQKTKSQFSLIFFLELWERFGYYGVVSLLVVYLIKQLNLGDDVGITTYSAFSALCYAFIAIGGAIGDKLLGTRRTTLLGAIILAIGYFLLSSSHGNIYIALGVIIAGNMLFKANPSSLVAKVYTGKDRAKLDGAFTMYYMAINIGSFLSMTLCPILQEKYNDYKLPFVICGVGLLIGIIALVLCLRLLKNIGSEPDFKPFNLMKLIYTIIIAIVIAVLSAYLLKHLFVTKIVLVIALIVTFGTMIKFMITASNKQERICYFVCIVLIVEAIVFFILYQQMQTSINLFTLRNTDCTMFGIKVPGLMFQNLNPFWIVVASPLLAMFYSWKHRHGGDFSVASKFVIGMFLCAIGFFSLSIGAYFFAHNNLISGNWVVLCYLFQSVGELLISGLGVSMVTKLVPSKVVGFVMGAWFMGTAVAMMLGGYVAALGSISKEALADPALSLPVYAKLFTGIGIGTAVVFVIMWIISPKLKKYIH